MKTVVVFVPEFIVGLEDYIRDTSFKIRFLNWNKKTVDRDINTALYSYRVIIVQFSFSDLDDIYEWSETNVKKDRSLKCMYIVNNPSDYNWVQDMVPYLGHVRMISYHIGDGKSISAIGRPETMKDMISRSEYEDSIDFLGKTWIQGCVLPRLTPLKSLLFCLEKDIHTDIHLVPNDEEQKAQILEIAENIKSEGDVNE